jgi:hypothetical protein
LKQWESETGKDGIIVKAEDRGTVMADFVSVYSMKMGDAVGVIE